MTGGYQQVTLVEFRTLLLSMLDNSAYWTAAEINKAINEALRVWNLMTGQWKAVGILPTVQNTHWLSTPSTLLYPIRMDFQSYPMYKTTWFDLDYTKSSWEGQTTATSNVPSRPNLWAPAGFNKVVIWPADASSSPSNMAVDGVASTPQLVNDDDYVNIGREEQGAILSYALHKLCFKEGGPRFQVSIQHFRNFLVLAGNKNSRLRASTFYKTAMQGDPVIDQKPMQIAKPDPTMAPN